MDDIVWFPVSEKEKEALERFCALQGITPRAWFKQVLHESEQGMIPFWQKSAPIDERQKGREQQEQSRELYGDDRHPAELERKRNFRRPEEFNVGEAAR